MLDQSIDLEATAMTNRDCIVEAWAQLNTWLAPGDHSNKYTNETNDAKRERALALLGKVLRVKS